MARVKFRVRWYLPLALCLLLLPFIIERTIGYYTDGQNLRAPEEEAEDSLRSVLWEAPRLVEGGVSTPGAHDYEPRVGPFGETLVFTRDLPGSNADLWVARKEKGQWVDPIPFSAVNSDASELGAAFSPDGSRLYFYSDRDGGHGGYDIWVSEQTPDGWSLPVNLGPGVNSPWNEMNPAPVPGDGALYFVSDRRPGEEAPPAWKSTVRSNLRLADWELYVAVRPEPAQETVVDQPGDDTEARVELPETELPKEESSTEAPEEPVAEAQPGEPQDVQGDSPVPRDEEPAAPAVLFSEARPVTELNTPGYADGTPAFSPLGDFIYFSSNRPGGEGSGNFDLYRARVAETGFVELESLGPQVNTTANELDPGIALRGYELYFSRDDAGGQTDIYFTLSREVRHVTESDGPYLSLTGILDWLARLIRNTPPWLISLLLALLVCGLLLLLFRRYILSPTVLAVCFLVALLFHVFTGFWMNRNKVQRLLLEVVQEEEYEAFEVALESIPEEVISLEIRETSAETKQDEAPALSAQLAAREAPRPQPTLERPAMEAPAIERPETEVLPFSETVLQREAIQAESSENLPEDLAFPEQRQESLTPEIIKRQLERPEEVAQEERELVSDLRVREVSQARVELPEIELPEREPVQAPQLKELERTDTQAPVLQASKLETENVEEPDVSPNEKQASQSEVELAARQLTPEERAKAEDSRIEVAREVSRSTPQENKPVERVETAVELARADPSEAQPEATQRTELSPVEQVDSPPAEKQAPTVENAPERAVVNSEQPAVEAKTLQRPEPVAESARENLAIKSAQPVSRPVENAESSIERPEVELNASPAAPPVEGAESQQRPAVATVGKAVAAADSPQADPEAPSAAGKVAAESDAPDVSRKQLEAPAEANPETGTPALEVARQATRAAPQESKPVERAEAAVELARADPSETQPETTQRRELSPVEQVDSPSAEKQAPTVENAPERAVVNSEQPSVEAKTLQRPEPVAESARESLAIKSAQPVSRTAESAKASIERSEVEFNASRTAPPVERAESQQRPAVAAAGKAVAAADSPQADPEAPSAAGKVAVESDAPDVSRKQLEAPAEANPETGTPALEVARQATRAASEISRTVAREVVELEVQKAKPASGAADSSNEAKLPDVGRAEAPRIVEKEVVAKAAPQRSESAGAEPTIAKRASVQAEAVEESVSKKVLALKQAGPVSRSRKAAEPVKAASAVVEVSRGESAGPAAPAGETPRRLQVASAGKAVAASGAAPSIQKPPVSKAETGAGTAPAIARRTTEAPQPEASGESQSRALKVASARLARTKVTEAVVGKTAERGKVALQRSAAGAAAGLEKTVRSAAVSQATQAVVSAASKGEAVPKVAAGAKTDEAKAPVVEERAVAKAGEPAPEKAPPKPAKLEGGSKLAARKSKTTRPKLSSVGRLSGISRLRRPRSTFQGGQGKSSARKAVARPQRVGAISSEGTELESIARVSKSTGDSAYLPKIYQLRGAERREGALMKGGGSSRTEAAVVAGLRWLAQHQSPDGKWTLDHYTDHIISPNPRDLQGLEWNGKRGKKYSKGGGYNYKGSSSGTVGTAMALLAFFGHGDSHLKAGPYRGAIDKGLKWLVKAQKKDGDLRGGGNLYMHGIAAFALTEAYAFTRDPALKGSAQLAIDFTVKAQVPSKGGWRYVPYPQSQDVDTSVFGWMMMALKSGKLGGLKVDKACLSRAAMYLENARMRGKKFGEYSYQPGGSRTTHAMTAQGFFCQKMLSDTLDLKKGRKAGEIRKFDDASMKYFMANLPVARDMDGVNFYYWYYATHALFQQGGQPWRIWNERLTDVLLEHQVGREHGTAYGSWDPRGKRAAQAGRLYSTVLSILCLEVYYRYAPLSDD
jgi:hypothetical protein